MASCGVTLLHIGWSNRCLRRIAATACDTRTLDEATVLGFCWVLPDPFKKFLEHYFQDHYLQTRESLKVSGQPVSADFESTGTSGIQKVKSFAN